MVSRLAFVLLMGLGLGLIFFNFRSSAKLPLVNIVVDSDPLTVVSFQKDNNSLVFVTIPRSLWIKSVHGLGTYPISSLWQLGVDSRSDGAVLAQSIEELLGLNINWFIGNVPRSAKDIFNLSTIPMVLTGDIKTNIPISMFLWLIWEIRGVTPDRIIEIWIPQSLSRSDILPDGTVTNMLTSQAVDSVLSDEFEIAEIRAEKMTISVLNSTDTAGLAESAARKISRIGGNVVRTGNAEDKINQCQVRGSSSIYKSKTVKILTTLLNCEQKEIEAEGYSDITVVMGREYEDLFTPDSL